MELAVEAVSPLLDKLRELLVDELTLEGRVRQDVVSLKKEMEWMDRALREVAMVDRPNEQVAHWAREVRELSYDMEDAVDAFMLRVKGDTEPGPGARGDLKSRVQELLKKTGRLFGKGKELHQIAGAVRDAQGLSKQLGELRQKYEIRQQVNDDGGGTGSGAGGDSIDPRLTAMFREATELVGVDGSRDELIERISDRSKKRVQTVSVVGAGGLGKTTLAKAVYDTVKDQFECGAFVSVSRSPDLRRIFKKMLYALDKEKYAHFNESADPQLLIEELRGFLADKRYLIVIDDIWDEKHWKNIKPGIPDNNCSSRLITTSRKLRVSEASCPSHDDKIYKMEPLCESDSQRLFSMRIFGHRNGCPPELEQVSGDILKKCGGVPLAIISIASLLASHKQIKAKDQWYTVLNSIGHGITKDSNMEDLREILSYSYYDLPSHLKACLLYLSIFPEDHDIGRDRLVWRWIAEGFVEHENNNDNLFQLGESYFNELINRSMIEPVGIDFEGRAQSCRVHDMVLDLIRSLSTKENFVTMLDGTETTSLQFKVRRLSLQNSRASGSATTTLLQARSFTAFSPAVDSMPSLSQFQVLRVLDLEGCALKKCGSHFNLKHVGNLSQLRYLGLRRTYIHELPAEIGKLQLLQTLDVRGAHGIQELPQTISRLRKLMCLHLDWDTKLPKGLSSLTSLQELTGLRIGQDSAHIAREELSHLTGLRALTMRWEKDTDFGEDLLKSFGNLRDIQSLDVYVNGGRGDLIQTWAPPQELRRFLSKGPTSHLSTLPAWVSSSSLPYLTSLDVWVRRVRRDDLQVLGALPALRGLRLRAAGRVEDDRGTERLPVVRAGAFPCARACAFLHFVTAPSIFPRSAMPVARQLEFSIRAWDFAGGGGGGGGGLIGLDDLRMEHLPSLEKIKVEIWYRGGGDQVEMVAAALRRAADSHPNHPTLRIRAAPVMGEAPLGITLGCIHSKNAK